MVEMVWKSQLEFEPRDSDKIWEWVVAIAAMAWNCWVPVDYEIWKNWIWYDVTLFVDRKHQETTWNWDVWSPFSEAKMGVIFYLLPRSVISLLDCRTWRVSVHLGMSIWAMNKKGPPGSSVYFFLGGWITTQLLVGIISSIMACSGSLLYKQPGLFMVQVYRPFFFSNLAPFVSTHFCWESELTSWRSAVTFLNWGAYRQATYAAWLDFFLKTQT